MINTTTTNMDAWTNDEHAEYTAFLEDVLENGPPSHEMVKNLSPNPMAAWAGVCKYMTR